MAMKASDKEMAMKVKTVIVGVDGSSNAQRALEVAVDMVADDGTVHVVTAHHATSSRGTADLLASIPEEFRNTFDMLAVPRGQLEDAKAFLVRNEVEHRGHLVEGHPAGEILDLADEVDADLIIVGSRGLGRATRFIRGSVSSRVATHAKTSFMVIHDEGAD